MTEDQRNDLLEALRFELMFLEHGGYYPSVRDKTESFSTFRDSPSCLNYAANVREHACAECWLMAFVPADKRNEDMPCHHIPLNRSGDTVASLGGPAASPELLNATREWLERAIYRLEQMQPEEISV